MPFEWNDQLSIGIYEIDEQHKNLVALANEALKSIHQDPEDEVIQIIIKELVEYTWAHFQIEEKMMRDSGYPEYLTHQQEHQLLTRDVAQFQKQLLEASIPDSRVVCEFIQHWLIYHIMDSDQHCGAFLKTLSIASPPSPIT